MGPSPNVTTTTPRRQSCDRCHGQKLRCTRPDNQKTGACSRCLRKGVLCAYSSSLPKGRPSLHRLNEIPAKPPSNSPSASSSSPPPAATPDDTPDSPDVTSAISSTIPVRPGHHLGGSYDAQGNIDIHGGTFASPGPFSDLWAPWCQDDPTEESMPGINFSSEPSLDLDHVLPLAGLDFSSLLSSSDSGTPANSTCTGQNRVPGGHDGRIISTSDANGFEFNIVHLSRLSTRLSQLLGSSRNFLAEALDPSEPSENDHSALQVQLGIEAVFKSVNSWLVHGSVDNDTASSSQSNMNLDNPFDPLRHVFSASNHLLEILRHVHVGMTSTSKQRSNSTGSNSYHPASNGGSEVTTTKPLGDSNHHSNIVVHHLVVVCVTLLLNMYVAILIALQRSVDVLNSHQTRTSTDQHRLTESENHTMDFTERAHLQLVSVVQLCSYFIRRQNQTLDILMSTSESPELGHLKAEVEQRLLQLQESLCIIT